MASNDHVYAGLRRRGVYASGRFGGFPLPLLPLMVPPRAARFGTMMGSLADVSIL
jgi:hypothetical protein